ncbi:MAG TPA: PA14 domain-containing protein [Bryobacteraceae bacterium]|nr:PA14 domain-containing protein [Bryobacteraceae bacterium]
MNSNAAAAWLLVSSLVAAPCSAQDKGVATFGSTVVIPSGLRGLIYYLRPGEAWLPDFSRLRPVGAIYTTRLNVPPQDFSLGFPGVTNRFEWFAIDYSGRFWIDKPGRYQFQLTSDDGAKLYIDDRVLINLDGQHPPETETHPIQLDCGVHHIRVSYFQGPRFQVALLLLVSGGVNKKWRLFDTEEFKPPPNPEDWVCDGKPVPYDPRRRTLTEALQRDRAASFEAEAMAALSAQPKPRDFAVRSAAFCFWQSAAGAQTSIALAVPGTGLAATRVERAVPIYRVHLALLALVKDAEGRVADKFVLDAPFEVPESEYAAVRTHDLVFSHPAHLAPGRYTIEAAVLDLEGRRAGTGTAQITVDTPAQRGGIGLSSLVLVDRIEAAGPNADAADPLIFEGKRVVPNLDPLMDPSANPVLYFVVYPDMASQAKPTVQVQFFDSGRLLAGQTAALPAPDASGAIPMFLAVAPRPGDIELKVTVTQGEDSAAGSLHYRLAGSGLQPPK